jgi:tyrosyl-tRNA synthetase
VRKDDGVSAIIDELSWRQLIAQSTDLDVLRAATAAGPVTLYCGFDPTAPSLHLGNLVQILTVRRFQQHGHRPLALVGGATGLIGDPRMTSERALNPADVVEEWVGRIRQQLDRFYDFSGPNAAVAVNNLDWTAGMGVLEFLRDVGKHFGVGPMLKREAVAARLAADGISYTEFSYALLQGYDFVQLHRRFGCTLQTGGSDQWGNIVAGVELIRKMEGASAHALTTPLMVKADGTKFGKTESGTVWLDPALTSPYAFFQFLLNTDDRDVAMMLRTFSFRPRGDLDGLLASVAERPQAREAQRALASELTALVHGDAERDAAEAAGRALFGQGDLGDLPPATLAAALAEASHVVLEPGEVVNGRLPAYDDLLARTGLVASKSAARRTIDEGGAYVNNVRIEDSAAQAALGDLHHGEWLVLRRGKKAFAGVRVPRP